MSDKQFDHREERKPRYQVRLPGFVNNDDIGLGDVVKRVTQSVGVRPCGGCERRAAALNQRVTFTKRNK